MNRMKSKRFSTNSPAPPLQPETSVSDLKKIYSEITRKMSFARSRSQTFDLEDMRADDSVRENGKLTKNHTLLFACIRGDVEAVQSLLREGIDVDYVNHNSTALHKAASYGHTAIIELLVTNGADIDARNADGMTALSIAVSQSHIDAVNKLLHYKASTQVVDNLGQSLLHHAARFSNVALLSILLDKPYSLDIFHQNSRGLTPLHAAAGNDNIDCVNELIKLGGSQLVNIVSNDNTNESVSTRGVTAFHLAAEFGFYDCFVACTSLQDVDMWKRTAAGATSLHLACKHGHANVVEHILNQLPDKFDATIPLYFDNKINTPLHGAALSRNPRCATLVGIKLLSSKSGKVSDWDTPNANKDYPAHLSSTNDNSDALREMLAHKVNISARNSQNETPLYIAVIGGFRNCVGLLLQAGATFTDMNANKSLKFEEIGNDIRIDAGTLCELVDHVITGNADEEFRKSFFIIYKCFTNATELLSEIRQKMVSSWENNDFVSRVVKVCEFWITNHSRDFRSDAQLLELMTHILKDVRERAGMEMVGKQMLALLTKKTHGPVTKRAREISKILTSGTQNFYVEDTGHVFAVTKSLKLAQQLSLIEYDIFYSIKKEELFHAAWNHKEKEHSSPNVIVFIGRFEQVSKWIRGMLLKAEKLSYRTKLLQKCIKVALKCYELRNYTTVMQIMAALESAPISRLNHTWAKISENMKDKYKAVCQQLLPAANYKNYRALIAKADPPCVPYIGTYLTDLTFIDEGNPDYIVDGSTKLINYKKFQMISELIQRIQRFQRIGYTFTLDNELKKYLLQSYVTMDDNTAYKLSLKIDPKVL